MRARRWIACRSLQSTASCEQGGSFFRENFATDGSAYGEGIQEHDVPRDLDRRKMLGAPRSDVAGRLPEYRPWGPRQTGSHPHLSSEGTAIAAASTTRGMPAPPRGRVRPGHILAPLRMMSFFLATKYKNRPGSRRNPGLCQKTTSSGRAAGLFGGPIVSLHEDRSARQHSPPAVPDVTPLLIRRPAPSAKLMRRSGWSAGRPMLPILWGPGTDYCRRRGSRSCRSLRSVPARRIHCGAPLPLRRDRGAVHPCPAGAGDELDRGPAGEDTADSGQDVHLGRPALDHSGQKPDALKRGASTSEAPAATAPPKRVKQRVDVKQRAARRAGDPPAADTCARQSLRPPHEVALTVQSHPLGNPVRSRGIQDEADVVGADIPEPPRGDRGDEIVKAWHPFA